MQRQDFIMHRRRVWKNLIRSEDLNSKNDLRDGELELINKYTRRSFSQDEIYTFSVILCDNEIDRDFERFSDKALYDLEKLFVGVTGVMDHDPKSRNQSARIFSCCVEAPQGRTTSDGRDYLRLLARAYVPVAQCSRDLITMIDSGIKKEVSVGCSVRKRICSVCGGNNDICGHIRGRDYDGLKCCAILDEPTDAYEWSFVAVPAQRKAGVIKSYQSMKTEESMNIEKKLRSQTEQHFTADEMKLLADKIAVLEEKAAQGEFYCKKLKEDIMALSASALPELSEHILQYVIDKMNITQLDEFKKSLEKKAAKSFPVVPQLFRNSENDKNNNIDYKNI